MARPPVKQRLFAHPARPRNTRVGGARQQGYGFFPASGTDYASGDEPEIASRLERLGEALKLHLTGISGARTPEHSVAVGGFANDPHTRGEASDTPGVEGVPESTLEKYGLTRPFGGTREADHIQLFGGNTSKQKGKVTARPRGRVNTPADWLKQAGWPSNLIPVMVAIGGAESGWNVGATHTNDDGSIDRGWLQINSVHGADAQRLVTDPVYTARVALQVYKDQGLGAWTTYTSGAYKGFMGKTPTPQPGRTRPGGEPATGDGSGGSGGSDVDTEMVAFWDHLSIPNPLELFKGAGKAIHSGTDFLKWIAWIFHPLNVLRVVEFWAGFQLIIMGFIAIIMAWRGASAEDVVSLIPQARAAKAATAVKASRATRTPRSAPASRETARKPAQNARPQLRVA